MTKRNCNFFVILWVAITLSACDVIPPSIDQLRENNMYQTNAEDTVSKMLRPLV